ncbi:MAG: peptidylprolyl isomerase [Muribaculaceae bacterium]|nr:peptidylprolyl isomerase [Muribaculaceae bacterium]
MKKIIIPIAVLALGAALWAKPKDPVVMTIDGQPVTLSEFEYLRHKNAGQQIEEESLQQYLDRFIDYKLKVIEAHKEGLDTTADFRNEYLSYRRELAQPYLQDTTVMQAVYDRAYAHTLEEVNIDHLMVALTDRARIDSIRNAVVNGADFIELAGKLTVDPSFKRNGGHYGWVRTGVYPTAFEDAAWETPVGQVSEVITTPYGYHLVQVLDHRPAEGQVHASHILVPTKEQADSLYVLVTGGANFADVARANSSCGSAPQGGDLGWFGRGQMVPEFEKATYELADGQISTPVQTKFGWHIILKHGSRQPEKAEVMEKIKAQAARDERSMLPRTARAEQLKKQYKNRVFEEGRAKVLAAVTDSGFKSAMEMLKADQSPLFQVEDSVVTIANFFSPNPPSVNPRAEASTQAHQVNEAIDNRLNSIVLTYESNRLGDKYPDFRNVDREYREGLMVYAVSDKHVWQRPTQDPAALDAYFQAHRDEYKYDRPHWKGYVIYATTDSLIQEVNKFLEETRPEPANVGTALKERFPKYIRIERVVLPEKNNQVVDYIAFGGPEPKFHNSVMMRYFTTYLGHMIDAPEEVADVRGRVTEDFNQATERQWVSELRQKYPVKVNDKVLKKLK